MSEREQKRAKLLAAAAALESGLAQLKLAYEQGLEGGLTLGEAWDGRRALDLAGNFGTVLKDEIEDLDNGGTGG